MSGIFEVTELIFGVGGEPRMSAALLAERLGMANRQTMMRLIERNMKSVLRFGEHIATVANNPSENGTRPTSESLATEAKYSVGGRPAKDVLLNEGQAVYIASKSGAPLAGEAHIGLVQVFLEWRHGGYSATVAKNFDGELDAKRDCYAAFPEVHQDRAGKRAEAQARVEDLMAEGMRKPHAIAAVAEETGVGERSLWSCQQRVYRVPQTDWQAAMAPRWNGARGMLAESHPEALALFVRPVLSGGRFTECYRRVVDEAAAQGWAPVAGFADDVAGSAADDAAPARRAETQEGGCMMFHDMRRRVALLICPEFRPKAAGVPFALDDAKVAAMRRWFGESLPVEHWNARALRPGEAARSSRYRFAVQAKPEGPEAQFRRKTSGESNVRQLVGFFDAEAAAAMAQQSRLKAERLRVAGHDALGQAEHVAGREVFTLPLGRFRLGLRKVNGVCGDAGRERIGGGNE